jgi:hypothetical protein
MSGVADWFYMRTALWFSNSPHQLKQEHQSEESLAS